MRIRSSFASFFFVRSACICIDFDLRVFFFGCGWNQKTLSNKNDFSQFCVHLHKFWIKHERTMKLMTTRMSTLAYIFFLSRSCHPALSFLLTVDNAFCIVNWRISSTLRIERKWNVSCSFFIRVICFKTQCDSRCNASHTACTQFTFGCQSAGTSCACCAARN